MRSALRWAAAPAAVGLLALGLWEVAVRAFGVPPYVLPGPVAIAAALRDDWPLLWPSMLVTRPSLLLMDEPFAALDEIARHRLNDDLLRLRDESGVTVVFVTHSVSESVYLSSRVAVMAARPGRVVADLPVPAPSPRPPGFRTSAGFADLCRAVAAALEGAMAA